MFIILWEYIVVEGRESEFENIYSSEGDWVQLFRLGIGYLGTELLRDPENSKHYITIDRWTSSTAFEAFHEKYHMDYETVDALCENLTEREILVGDITYSFRPSRKNYILQSIFDLTSILWGGKPSRGFRIKRVKLL